MANLLFRRCLVKFNFSEIGVKKEKYYICELVSDSILKPKKDSLLNILKINLLSTPVSSNISSNSCLVIAFYLFLLISACQSGSISTEKSLQEIKLENKNISNSAIIRNPVTANHPVDTVNVAKMTFDHIRYRYGEVEEGEIVSHTFSFTNTGKAPLIISEAKSTCGCTVPEWPKEPIGVGESGEINVRFNTANKKKYQTKPVFITANTHPSETTLYLIGSVKEKGRRNNDL